MAERRSEDQRKRNSGAPSGTTSDITEASRAAAEAGSAEPPEDAG
jgi:hypothetical protein